MRSKPTLAFSSVTFVAIILVLLTMSFSCTAPSKTSKESVLYTFYGGPKGGTFRHMAKGISDLAEDIGLEVRSVPSHGSIYNIRKVNSKQTGLGVAYASHIYMAMNGLLKGDSKRYKNIRVLGYLYGAPAQLIVRRDSGINSAFQLAGKRVGVGNQGSGSAIQCEIFFKELGIWNKIRPKYAGYNDSAAAFTENKVDAFWLFTTFPSGAAIMAAQLTEIQLINVYNDGEKVGMFDRHPYFAKTTIPGDTYKGVYDDIITFQDSSLLIANSNVPNQVVYKLLNKVYSEDGIKHMISLKKTAKGMSQNDGNFGISTQIHPGAIQYYKSKGF